jgi:signal transduction histidine kinase
MMAFILLFISYLLNLYATTQVVKRAKMVDHTNTVIINVESLVSTLKDAESGYRGYLLLNNEAFLVPYYRSFAPIDSLYRSLSNLTIDNANQGKRIETLRSLTQQRYSIWQNGIRLYKQNAASITDELRQTGYVGKKIMDSIKHTVEEMKNEETILMKERQKKLSASAVSIQIIAFTSLVIAGVLAVYAYRTYNKENLAKKEADKKALQYRAQLEERIEELDRLNEELVNLKSTEKFAATGRIARTIAHEVRNPLTNISLAAEQLKGEIPENDETEILLNMINRNTTRINQMISELLTSTRFGQLDFKEVLVNELMDETLDLAKDSLEENGVKVEKSYAADKEVFVDKEKMKIALLNVIVNATEAMEAGKGVLKIKTEEKKNKCVITISDNGSGISEESLSRLFEPYYTSKMKGTGLGLTNTQNIILNHKGIITAESEDGKGSSFIITLDPVKGNS